MSVEITGLGHASFRLASEGCVVYVGPWKIKSPPHDADVVFISHSHYDHCSPKDVQRVGKDDTTIIAPAEAAGVCKMISPGRAIPYHWGDIVGSQADAQTFAAAGGGEVNVLQPGESITV